MVFVIIAVVLILILPGFLIRWSTVRAICQEIADKPFICPNCGHKFYVNWYQMFFKRMSVYTYKNANLKCPACGVTDMCRYED